MKSLSHLLKLHPNKSTTLLILIIIVGILLRALAIFSRDFWFDEAFTYHLSRLPLNQLFAATLTDNNPPLYYLLIHLILNVSRHEIIVRLPSLIAGVISISLIYMLGKKTANSKTGLIAASLFAASPLSVYLATEARPHSLGLLLTILITNAFVVFLKKPSRKHTAIFIIITILSLYTHYYIGLLILPFTWIVNRKGQIPLKKWFTIVSIIAIGILPWLIKSLPTIHSVCSCPHSLLSLPGILLSPAIGGVGVVSMRSFSTLPLTTLILFTFSAMICVFFFGKGLMHKHLISTLYLIPLGTLTLLGFFLPVFSAKAFAIFNPVYFLIVALGITSFRKPYAAYSILVILLTSITLIQIENPFFAGEKLKPIAEIISSNPTAPVAHLSLLTYYSLKFYAPEVSHLLLTQNPLSPDMISFIGGERQSLPLHSQSLWLIDTQKWTDDKGRQQILETISHNFTIQQTFPLGEINILYLRRR